MLPAHSQGRARGPVLRRVAGSGAARPPHVSLGPGFRSTGRGPGAPLLGNGAGPARLHAADHERAGQCVGVSARAGENLHKPI